jgi:hypothetical protein
MARFDIGSAASRQTGLETRMRNEDIRREIQPKAERVQQAYVAPETPMETQKSGIPSFVFNPPPLSGEPPKPPSLPMPYQTIQWEGRRDKQGNLEVYKLPSGDMGGSFEVAGINDRYHPEAFKEISSLPPEQREEAAAEYIQSYTAPLVSKLPEKIQPFTQDLAFNRGLGGATRYLQQGLNALGQKVSVDGAMGQKTLEAISKVQPRALMQAASQAQLDDEYRKAEIDPRRKKFIPGLENRIRNRLAILGQI